MAQRPLLPEDCVDYHVYPACNSREELSRRLEEVREWLWTRFPFLGSYIWQLDPFELSEDTDVSDAAPLRLSGSTRFGDCLGDEWFIVFLLIELSRAFDDIVVEMEDSDGQFILIETAMHLPDWLDPETCDNRVFIHRGQLHLLSPPPEGSNDNNQAAWTPKDVSLDQAVKLVRQFGPRGFTTAGAAVQEALEERLSSLPGQALVDNHHNCRVLLPMLAARLLRADPSLVALAVAALFYRDPDVAEEVTALRTMPRVTPTRRPLMTRVRFSRLLFAQLLHEQWLPARGAPFNPLSAPPHPLARATSLGAKLAAGLELYALRNPKEWEARVNALPSACPEDLDSEEATADDDDAWLHLAPEALEGIMEPRERQAREVREVEERTEGLKQFLEHESPFDGAEVPSGGALDDEGEVFDGNAFWKALQRGLDLPEESVEDARVRQHQDEMDLELEQVRGGDYGGDSDDESPDLDLNLVQSILSGFEAADGQPGPMHNLLSQLNTNNTAK